MCVRARAQALSSQYKPVPITHKRYEHEELNITEELQSRTASNIQIYKVYFNIGSKLTAYVGHMRYHGPS